MNVFVCGSIDDRRPAAEFFFCERDAESVGTFIAYIFNDWENNVHTKSDCVDAVMLFDLCKRTISVLSSQCQ